MNFSDILVHNKYSVPITVIKKFGAKTKSHMYVHQHEGKHSVQFMRYKMCQ